MIIPTPGFYYHYKHDPAGPVGQYAYEFVGVARHTETEEFLVIYLSLYINEWLKPASLNARPLEMFTEDVTKDGKTFSRFQKITDPETIAKLEQIKKEMYS